MRKRTGTIQQRGEFSFRIRYVNADGLRQSETIAGTREEAEQELAIRLGQLASGLPVSSKPNTVLFGELADDVLTDYEVNRFASLSDTEARFRLHLIPIFGGRKAAQITTAQIRSYVLLRQGEHAKTGTINRELELMRHTFNLALEGRKLLHAAHVPMLEENNVREGFFTEEEVRRLVGYLPQMLGKFVLFLFLTGWRIGEARKLQWSSVDFDRNEIRIWVGRDKNRKGRIVPMTRELRSLLEAMTPAKIPQKPTLHGSHASTARAHVVISKRVPTTLTPLVFTNNGKPIGDFRKTWATACHKAGLPCVVAPVICRSKPVLDKDGKPTVKILKCLRMPHDLRRSFAREMDTQGMRRGAIKLLAGWKTDSVFNRYNIVSEADLRTEIERIEEAKHGKPPIPKSSPRSR